MVIPPLSRAARRRRWAGFALLALLAAGRAHADNATNVNDCTLLKDPTELRDCLLRFEGLKSPPPIVSEGPAAVGDSTSDLPPDAAAVAPGTVVPVAPVVPGAPAQAGAPVVPGTPVVSGKPAPRGAAPLPLPRSQPSVLPIPAGPNPSVRPRANDTATSIEQIEYPPSRR